MTRFNLALRPDAKNEKHFLKLAQFIAPHAASYCLKKEQSLPHITICQFSGKIDHAEKIAAKIRKWQKPVSLVPHSMQWRDIRDFGNKRDLALWIGIKPDAKILSLKAAIDSIVSAASAKILTPSNGYEPHFTIGTVNKNHAIVRSMPPWPKFLGVDMQVKLQLGLSSDGGEYLTDLDL